jgi:hypothetical protein
MKFVASRAFADPEVAARKLIELAKGGLVLHESGTYVRFTDAGAALFA